jgi:hypothetical protein
VPDATTLKYGFLFRHGSSSTFTYHPKDDCTNLTGKVIETFSYTVSDGRSPSSKATGTITIVISVCWLAYGVLLSCGQFLCTVCMMHLVTTCTEGVRIKPPSRSLSHNT